MPSILYMRYTFEKRALKRTLNIFGPKNKLNKSAIYGCNLAAKNFIILTHIIITLRGPRHTLFQAL